MIQRCSSDLAKFKKYRDCSVDGRWLDFETFCKDLLEMKGCFEQEWALDKDILNRGNKIYSKENCCLVPRELNNILEQANASRGKYLIGVYKNKNAFVAGIRMLGKNTYIGRFSTEIEAHLAYKRVKESYIKERASFWRDRIDPKVYEALCNFEVRLED